MIEYKIGNCHYRVVEGTPRPGIDFKLRSKRAVMRVAPPPKYTPSRDRIEIPYLKWLYPENKDMQKVPGSADISVIKDPDTGTARWLLFLFNRKPANRKRKIKASCDTYQIEIPHWGFNPNILEDTCLLS